MGDIFGILIVRPLGMLLNLIYNAVESYGLAIILFALIVKIVILPISYHGKKNMLRMSAMQGKMQQIQKQYANNKVKMNEELSKLYEKEGVNPMSGCLPTFLPLPIMIGLYYAVVKPLNYMMGLSGGLPGDAGQDINLLANAVGIDITQQNAYTIQASIAQKCNEFFHNGVLDPKIAGLSENIKHLLQPLNFNFFGLDLSAKPTFALNLLLLIPLLSGLTAFLSSWIIQKMQGNQGQNAQMQGSMKTLTYMMPLMSVYFAFQFPVAIGIYWIFNNILTCVQEIFLTKFIRKRYPTPPAGSPKGGKKEGA